MRTHDCPAVVPEAVRSSRTSGVGGLHEVVEHGVPGCLIRPTIWPGCRQRGTAADRPGPAQELRRGRRRVVVNRFCADRVVPVYEQFYRALGPPGAAGVRWIC